MLVSKLPIPILDVKYAKRRVDHLSTMIDNIYNTGGTIQPSDMQCLFDTLHDLKELVEAYEAAINQLEDEVKESIS